MTINKLINLAYIYYPKYIDNIHQKELYLKSDEYIRLSELIKEFSTNDINVKIFNLLEKKLIEFDYFYSLEDTSLLSWEDRCYSFEINFLNNNELTKIYLYISILVPLYFVYIEDCNVNLSEKPFRFHSILSRNIHKEKNEYKQVLHSIDYVLKKDLQISQIEEDIANIVINDVNFHDIKFNTFTIFNAFFLDVIRYK